VTSDHRHRDDGQLVEAGARGAARVSAQPGEQAVSNSDAEAIAAEQREYVGDVERGGGASGASGSASSLAATSAVATTEGNTWTPRGAPRPRTQEFCDGASWLAPERFDVAAWPSASDDAASWAKQ
jgi:hypothetical protein